MISKQEAGDRASRHNNPGAVMITDELSKKFNAIPGDAFPDNPNFKTAYFENPDDGVSATKHIIKNLYYNADGDLNKFASIYTLGKKEPETDNEKTIVNRYVSEIQKELKLNNNSTEIAFENEINNVKTTGGNIDDNSSNWLQSVLEVSKEETIEPLPEMKLGISPDGGLDTVAIDEKDSTKLISEKSEEEKTNKDYVTDLGLTEKEIEILANDVRTNGYGRALGAINEQGDIEAVEELNLPKPNFSSYQIAEILVNAENEKFVNAPDKTGLDIFNEAVDEHFRNEPGRQYDFNEAKANITKGVGAIAYGTVEFAKTAGEAVFMPEKFPELVDMTTGMLSLMFVDMPSMLIDASGISPYAPIGSQKQLDALNRIWDDPIAPIAYGAGFKAMPRQFRAARSYAIKQLAKGETLLKIIDEADNVNQVVNLDPKVKFTPEMIEQAKALQKKPKPFKDALRKEIDIAKQLELQFEIDAGLSPKPKSKSKGNKTDPNDVLPLDKPIKTDLPKPTRQQIDKAKKAEKTRFDKRREKELRADQDLMVESLNAIDVELQAQNIPGGKKANLLNAQKRTRQKLVEIQTEMVQRNMEIVKYFEAGYPFTKSMAKWAAKRALKGLRIGIGKMRNYTQASVDAGPFRFAKNNPFWSEALDNKLNAIRWQTKQQKLNNMASDSFKGQAWDSFMQKAVDINWIPRKKIMQSNATDAVKNDAIARLELNRGIHSASAYDLEQFVKKVEKGLTPKDVDGLNAYVQGWREVEIYKRNQDILRTVPDEIKELQKGKQTAEIVKQIKDKRKLIKEATVYEYSLAYKIDPITLKRVKDSKGNYIKMNPYDNVTTWQTFVRAVALENPIIHERAMMIFDKYKKNANELYKANIFTDAKYQALNMYDYQRKAYLVKNKNWNGEYKTLGKNAISVSDDYIRQLSKGNPGALDNNYKLLMADALNTKYALMFENKANLALANLIDSVPDNGFALKIKKIKTYQQIGK